MTIRRLYGSDENVGGGTWELFLLENPTDDERTRWWMALDALPPTTGSAI